MKPLDLTVTTPAADPAHPSHAQAILGGILAAWQRAEPVVITFLPPSAQLGVELGTALTPLIISTVEAIKK